MIALADLVERAERLCATARPGEVIEVHAAATTREGIRWDDAGTVVPQGAHLRALVRVETAGRAALLALSGQDLDGAQDAVSLLRRLAVRHGQPALAARHAHPAPDWQGDERCDQQPGEAAVLARVRARFADEAAAAQAQVGSGALLVERDRVAFASSSRGTSAYERTVVEGRCFIEVTGRAGEQGRATALTYAHGSDALRPGDAVTEAAQDAWASVGEQVAAPPPPRVLLPPRKAAQLVGLAVRDVVTAGRRDVGAVPELVDDGLAPGAPDARPFDVEGSPTGRIPLVGPDGQVRALHSRGTATEHDLLGGHSGWREYDTAPQAWPTNVVLALGAGGPDGFAGSPESELPFCHGVSGADVMHLRTSDRLILGLELAGRSGAGDVVRQGQVQVTATAAELLRALTPLTAACAFVRGREFSTGSGWALLDLARLRLEHDHCGRLAC